MDQGSESSYDVLQRMNDDCFLKIFSLKSLTVLDLCSLARTCTRFKRIVERISPEDLSVNINGDYDVASGNYLRSKKCGPDDIKGLFMNFSIYNFNYNVSVCEQTTIEFFVGFDSGALRGMFGKTSDRSIEISHV